MTPTERWLRALAGDIDAMRQVLAYMDRQARVLGLSVPDMVERS